MKIACIVGIDGTGKSTLARAVAKALDAQGIPARCIYGKTYPVLSRALISLGKASFLRRHDVWLDYGSYATTKKQTMNNRFLSTMYTLAVLLDYFPQMWLKLLPHAIAGRTVVCDRYVYDTVINDLAVHLNYSQRDTARAIAAGLLFLPKPAITILLDVPPEVALGRKDDVPHIDYLIERQSLYRRLKYWPGVRMLDGRTPVAELVSAVLEGMMSSDRTFAPWSRVSTSGPMLPQDESA